MKQNITTATKEKSENCIKSLTNKYLNTKKNIYLMSFIVH